MGASREERRFQYKLERKRELLELVRSCHPLPESERLYRRYGGFGFVYLMEKRKLFRQADGKRVRLSVGEYKIGRTKRPPHLRSQELSKEQLYSLTRYMTPVPIALEQQLHLHYDDFRIKRDGERRKDERANEAGERFRLTEQELEAFKATAAKVERWVLLAEEARLELEIMRMEAKPQ